jgi:hypothetical protein
MEFPQLSVAPEVRRGTNVYHFSYRDAQPERRGFSRQDTLTFALRRLFESDLPNVAQDMRDQVINIIVNELDVEHKNLLTLCVATTIVYHMRLQKAQLTPDLFRAYYITFASVIEKGIPEKKSKDPLLPVKFKAVLYRYITYVYLNSKDFNRQIETRTE